MRKIFITIIAAAMALAASSCGSKVERLTLNTEQDTLSWAAGVSSALAVQNCHFPFDQKAVKSSFDDVLDGKEGRLPEDAFNEACEFINFLTMMSQNGREVKLKDNVPIDTISWAMGAWLAQTLESGFYEFDSKVVSLAFRHTLDGGANKLDEVSYVAACQQLAQLAQDNMQKIAETASEKADVSEEEYFKDLVAKNPNIKKSEDGYYYEVLREGKGPKAQLGLRVKFDFRSSEMLTGKEMEKTYGVREPLVKVLAQPMFPGLLSGMQMMNAGSKYRFYFPHKLVAGTRGVSDFTPVIYEVELHEIYLD